MPDQNKLHAPNQKQDCSKRPLLKEKLPFLPGTLCPALEETPESMTPSLI